MIVEWISNAPYSVKFELRHNNINPKRIVVTKHSIKITLSLSTFDFWIRRYAPTCNNANMIFLFPSESPTTQDLSVRNIKLFKRTLE